MRQRAVSIKDVLNSVVLQLSGEKKTKIGSIQEAWDKTTDKNTQGHARPVGFKAKKLIVNVDSSAWMYELNMRKPQMKTKLNDYLQNAGIAIDEIILRIGEAG